MSTEPGEDVPVVDPMLNDLRAARFDYQGLDVDGVLGDLDRASAGLVEEIRRIASDGWRRRMQRLPGEERTVAWLVRNAAHEIRHHAWDVRHLDT